MTSNIKIQRICQYCDDEFTARTTTTKYCSDICAKRAYKARKRAEKINKSKDETIRIKIDPINVLQQKEFLTAREVSTLLGCSIRTTYRLIETGKLDAVNLAQRMTRIKRSSINEAFNRKETKRPQTKEYKLIDCYKIAEIQEKYNLSRSTVQQLIKRNNIPIQKKGKYAFVPKIMIDKIFN